MVVVVVVVMLCIAMRPNKIAYLMDNLVEKYFLNIVINRLIVAETKIRYLN